MALRRQFTRFTDAIPSGFVNKIVDRRTLTERYFDNAATTPVDERVVSEMLPYLHEGFGNANSIHEPGRRAHAAVELARARIAELIGAEDPLQILFTSGATESNNQILRSYPKIAVSPFEHSSIIESAAQLEFDLLANDGLEINIPEKKYDLVSLMRVNNEIGTIWDPMQLSDSALFLHSDLTQAVGKIRIDVGNIDFASFSSHKLYGPKGIGAVYFQNQPPATLIYGGEQENGLRGGTLNVPGIVGFGAAAAIAGDELDSSFALASMLRAEVLEGIRTLSDWCVNGGALTSPYILSISFLGVEGESLVVELDREGFAISSGAACSSHSLEPSHVLRVLKIEEALARGTIRISFGRFCTIEAAQQLSASLRRTVENLRRMGHT